MKKLKNNPSVIILFFTGCFLLSFWLTAITPLVADDFDNAMQHASYGMTRVTNLDELKLSMLWLWYTDNGRILAHSLIALFTMASRWVYPAANAAVTTLFFLITFCFFRAVKLKSPITSTALLYALVWILMPAYGQVWFWLSGACNYGWGATLAWLVIYLFMKTDQKETKSTLWILLFLPLAFAAGAWSEHISFSMLVILAFLWMRDVLQHRRLPIGKTGILIAACWGYWFLMSSPAELPRKLKVAAFTTAQWIRVFWNNKKLILLALGALAVFVGICLLWHRKKHRLRKALAVLSAAGAVLGTTASLFFAGKAMTEGGIYAVISSTEFTFFVAQTIFFFFLFRTLRQAETEEDQITLPMIFYLGGISILPLFVFGASYVPPRGLTSTIVFTLVASILLMDAAPLSQKGKRVRTLVFALCLLGFMAAGILDIVSVHREAVRREEIFAEAAAGDGCAVLSPYHEKTKYSAQYGLQDLEYDAGWPNGVMANYYGVTRIIVTDDEKTGPGRNP